MTEYSPAKTVEYPRIFPNFENCARCEKDLKDNKDNSLHLGRTYARIFVLRHYLFLVAHSFLRASLSETCWLFGTDNVRGQISLHIFAPYGDYCFYIFILMWKNFRNAVNETSGVGISWLGEGSMGVWKTRIGNSE